MEESQNATQPVLDPRRLGQDNSGLNDDESADIMLILVAGSPAATRIVEQTASTRDYHVLYHDTMNSYNIEEEETIIIGDTDTYPHTQPNVQRSADIALRFSSIKHLKQKYSGFVFGRNATLSDIVFFQDSGKRISNQHFRIYLNSEGLIMLEDLSTNGTRVDNIILKSKDPKCSKSRILTPNTEIVIANVVDAEVIRFIVRQPPRGPREQLDRYEQNRQNFMSQCLRGEEREKVLRQQQQPFRPAMKWNGGNDYTIMGKFLIILISLRTLTLLRGAWQRRIRDRIQDCHEDERSCLRSKGTRKETVHERWPLGQEAGQRVGNHAEPATPQRH